MSSDTPADCRCMRLADCTTIALPAFTGRGVKSLHGPTPLPVSLKGVAGTSELLIGRSMEATTSVKPPQHEPVRQGEISEISQ